MAGIYACPTLHILIEVGVLDQVCEVEHVAIIDLCTSSISNVVSLNLLNCLLESLDRCRLHTSTAIHVVLQQFISLGSQGL